MQREKQKLAEKDCYIESDGSDELEITELPHKDFQKSGAVHFISNLINLYLTLFLFKKSRNLKRLGGIYFFPWKTLLTSFFFE